MKAETTIMNRCQFLTTLGVTAVAFTLPSCAFAANPATKSKRPNFVFIIADDLCWGDLGRYENRESKF